MFVKLANFKLADKPPFISWGGALPGTLVAVRPCADQYENKTFLGVYLGDFPSAVYGTQDEPGGDIVIDFHERTNPLIFIPEFADNRFQFHKPSPFVYGAGSWWGKIKSEEHLRDITDGDIENVWYVRALKQIDEIQGK